MKLTKPLKALLIVFLIYQLWGLSLAVYASTSYEFIVALYITGFPSSFLVDATADIPHLVLLSILGGLQWGGLAYWYFRDPAKKVQHLTTPKS
jgi:hypothetical protein